MYMYIYIYICEKHLNILVGNRYLSCMHFPTTCINLNALNLGSNTLNYIKLSHICNIFNSPLWTCLFVFASRFRQLDCLGEGTNN